MTNQNNQKKRSKHNLTGYISIGTQAAAIVAVGIIAGNWLDNYFQTEKAYYTLALGFIMIILSVYQLLKNFSK